MNDFSRHSYGVFIMKKNVLKSSVLSLALLSASGAVNASGTNGKRILPRYVIESSRDTGELIDLVALLKESHLNNVAFIEYEDLTNLEIQHESKEMDFIEFDNDSIIISDELFTASIPNAIIE